MLVAESVVLGDADEDTDELSEVDNCDDCDGTEDIV